MNAQEKRKEDNKILFQFRISKETDRAFRVYLSQRQEGFHKGDLSKEVELAINEHIGKEDKE